MAQPGDELIPTRASLIARLKDWQDQSSWQEFFDTYWKLIYGVARKTGMTDAEAQDAVQETSKSVVKHMPGFQYDPAVGSFKAWLLKLTRWRIADQFRKRLPAGFEPLAEDTGTSPLEQLIDPESQVLDALWDAEWEKNLLDAAIAIV